MGLDGDIRVHDNPSVIALRNAPAQLHRQGLNPGVPWLSDFQLDFPVR